MYRVGVIIGLAGLHVVTRWVLQTGLVLPQKGRGRPVECIIHQTWKSENLSSAPQGWLQAAEAWKAWHPDCQYKLWTDESLRNFISDKFSWFLNTYDSYPHVIQRVDSARYFILYEYGGLYSDLDIAPLQNVSILFKRGVTLPITPNVGLSNALMASPKKTFFLQACYSSAANRLEQFLEISRAPHAYCRQHGTAVFVGSILELSVPAGNYATLPKRVGKMQSMFPLPR